MAVFYDRRPTLAGTVASAKRVGTGFAAAQGMALPANSLATVAAHGQSISNRDNIDPRNMSAGRKAGMRTRSRNARLTGTVLDVGIGRATNYTPGSASPIPAVVQQHLQPRTSPFAEFYGQGALPNRTVLPQNVRRVGRLF